MKYFTPERYLALQDFSSGAAMNAAEAAWEGAVDQYEAYLQSVRPTLPPSVSQLLEGFFLHDSDVLSMGRHGDAFVVVLQLDTPPHDLLTLTYALAGEPVIDQGALPAGHRSPRPRWMHEELEVTEGAPPHYIHSVLLSNGWELRLPFRDVQLTAAQPVYPSHHAAVARSA